MHTVTTIGYEGTNVERFLETLRDAGVGLVVDVRAVARSRRPGFAKTRLAANLHGAGIDYLHLPALGSPPDARAAARAGDVPTLRRLFGEHLATPEAHAGLETLAGIVESGVRVSLLCFEAEARECHRLQVAEALAALVPVEVIHLRT